MTPGERVLSVVDSHPQALWRPIMCPVWNTIRTRFAHRPTSQWRKAHRIAALSHVEMDWFWFPHETLNQVEIRSPVLLGETRPVPHGKVELGVLTAAVPRCSVKELSGWSVFSWRTSSKKKTQQNVVDVIYSKSAIRVPVRVKDRHGLKMASGQAPIKKRERRRGKASIPWSAGRDVLCLML